MHLGTSPPLLGRDPFLLAAFQIMDGRNYAEGVAVGYALDRVSLFMLSLLR